MREWRPDTKAWSFSIYSYNCTICTRIEVEVCAFGILILYSYSCILILLRGAQNITKEENKMKLANADLIEYINETIEGLFESIKADRRYDAEAAEAFFEAHGAMVSSLHPSYGYDMTDEEHKKYMKLLELKRECVKIQNEVDEIFDSI